MVNINIWRMILMRAIVCEMCGSNEFKKIDGEYQCLHCKTRYTVDEAKKLMIEGTVDVKGTVQIDDSNKTDNYQTLASRAFENEQYDQAYEYYSKLLEINTDNWMYIYKKGICSAKKSTLAQFKVDEVVKACKDALRVLEKNEVKDLKEVHYKMASEINEISIDFRRKAGSQYNKDWEAQSAAPEYWERLKKCLSCEEYAMNLIEPYIKTEVREFELYKMIVKNCIFWFVELCAIRRYRTGYNQYGPTYNNISYKDSLRPPILAKYDQYVAFLKQYDSTYVAPQITRKGVGCYVATCVYGSYDCPEVWVLRRYRDYKLNNVWYGRLFIKMYYAVSPTIVKWFGKNKWFNRLFKKKLDRTVNKLKLQGYKSTYYEDMY